MKSTGERIGLWVVSGWLAVFALAWPGCSLLRATDPAPDVEPDHGAAATGIVRRAVVVGMLRSQFAGLCSGADVDADIAAEMMRERGLATTTLRDRQCTRASALAAFEKSIAGAGPGSLLMLYWSGHGGQRADRNGDEEDGLDEYLCPWDQPLLDDDLAALCDTIPAGVRVFAMFDTCNSGTMARRALSRPRIVNPRTFKASLIVYAGCADGKSSFGGEQGGRLTTAWIDAWREGITYEDWFAALEALMLAANKHLSADEQQVPQYVEYGDCEAFRKMPALE